MASKSLLSPRGRSVALGDLHERRALVAGQRVGRTRRRRPRARVGRWLRVAAATVLVVAGVGSAAAATRWLLTSPRFAIGAVEVRGASRVPAERIVAAAGIAPGANLWAIEPREVLARIEAMPEIRRADLVRELPNHVTIHVEERRPFTLVHAARLHWLDEDGYQLGLETRAVTPAVPVISGLSEEELATMRTAPSTKARKAIALIRALLRTGSALASEIAEIDVGRPDGPVLWTVDGIEIRLGNEEWEERLARLEGVLAQVATQDVRGVDLRFRDQVVLRRGSSK